jgi:nitroreductase
MSATEHATSVLAAIYGRRATRAYLPRAVDEDTVRTLLAAAVQAPTAMHREPWRFAVVQDRAKLAQWSTRAKTLMLAETAHHPLVRGERSHGSDLLGDPSFNIFYDAGTLIVIGGDGGGPFVAADCWLAAQNLMLAAHAMGMATCPIGFAVSLCNTPEIKTELGFDEAVTAVAPIILGYSSVALPPVPRKQPVITAWR